MRQDLAEGHPRALQPLQRHGAGVTKGPPEDSRRDREPARGARWKPGTRPDRRRLGSGGEEMGAREDSGRQFSQTQSLSDMKSLSQGRGNRDTSEWATSGPSGGHVGHAPRAYTCSEGARARAGALPRVGTPGLFRAPWWSEERVAGWLPGIMTRTWERESDC